MTNDTDKIEKAAERLATTLDDTHNGLRLVKRHGANIRYVAEDRQWLVWDETRWKADTLGTIFELAKDTALDIYRTAAKAAEDGNTEVADALARWAKASLSVSKLEAMVKAARTVPDIAISAESLDQDVWLLNFTNGTVDLRTGQRRAARREDLITKSTGYEYNPKAKCPQWESFVAWTMKDRPELITFIHRALGMSLCGDVSERKVFLLHGSGDNGKSVTLKTVLAVTGEYGMRMETSTLEAAKFARGGGNASENIARLKGARFVYTSEVEDGTKLAAALLKDLTGDEMLTARHLYKSTFTFKPELTPFIGANHKPVVPSDDQAVWNRLRTVPYENVIAEADKDGGLGDRLLDEEAPGILAWLVRGCVEWQKSGLTSPAVVLEATAQYRDEMDTFADWIAYITTAGPIVSFAPVALRGLYNEWAKDNTEDGAKMSQRVFKAHMEARGWTQEADSKGIRRWTPPGRPVRRVNYSEMARAALAQFDAMSEEELETA